MLLDECLAYRPANTRLARLDLQDHPIEATQVIARMGAALQLMNADFDRLGEVLTKTVQPLWLVLDGYPSLPDADLDRLVKELIQSSSPRVRWWITTRNRPKMQLARMLLNGELFELDARRLAKKPKYKTT
ncbi:LuxR family transcriptional regulator [Pseudomonas alkylphenolica]|uniref:LuxR family transcriptional regulator n=2 Tax=Pseudomonas alkylphenolica TaxID=237609 RepID=A0A077F8Q3_9PSED|nr:LuxR family transcriptional regulator [Pseudomonas alkylphenolica]